LLHGTKTVIKHKIGLLNLAEDLGNVSKACRIMGLSRDTFYRYQNAVEQGGVEALIDRRRASACSPLAILVFIFQALPDKNLELFVSRDIFLRRNLGLTGDVGLT
jgi:hypothetical protein